MVKCHCTTEMSSMHNTKFVCKNKSCRFYQVVINHPEVLNLTASRIYVLKMDVQVLFNSSFIDIPTVGAASFIAKQKLDVVMLRIKYFNPDNNAAFYGYVYTWALEEVLNKGVF